MFWVPVVSLLSALAAISSAEYDTDRWSEAAHRWLQRDCHHCIGHKSQARLYIATPSSHGKLRVVSADGGSRHSGVHDSVLIIDPTPHLRFGHPIYMFFVDLNFTRPDCEARTGILLEGGDCLTQWTRPRCHRRLPLRRGGGCSLLYPPEVRALGSEEDLLRCSDLWSSCPPQRKPSGSTLCDPLATNSKGCEAGLSSPCVFMRSCHHALLLSGGWNRQMSDHEAFNNIHRVNNMLRKNGFAESNIKIFFGNGLTKSEEAQYSSDLGDVYPSSLKFALRYHLKSLCELKHCTNTLFVYLNSPARPDGGALLWDASGNGEFDESEVYTLKEMIRDLGNCKARRLVIVSDQLYSNELIRNLNRHSSAFKNTFVIHAKPEDNRTSIVDNLSVLAPWQCLSTLNPTWEGTELENSTLSGNPCDDGLREDPAYCQNLSTLEMLEPEKTIGQS